MDKSLIPVLAEVLELYYDYHELTELASIFEVNWTGEIFAGSQFRWLPVARQLVEQIDRGNHYVMLASLLDAIEQRNKTAIARTDWERRDAHETARGKVEKLIAALREPGIAREIVVAENKPFTAKAEVREFLEKAESEIFVVDPYVGLGTLDCLRSVKSPIRLLTGSRPNSIEDGFENALNAFRAEGFQIEVRRHAKLHDRHIMFNERCWLLGSSLKDAGRKAFHTMEIVDSKAQVMAALEEKWLAGEAYPAPAPAAAGP
jgi:hypothetical protein